MKTIKFIIIALVCSFAFIFASCGAEVINVPDYSMYNDHFDFYGYSAATDGTYKLDGIRYDTGTDYFTEEQYNNYINCGMTIYFPQSAMNITDDPATIEKAKKVIDELAELGIHRTILADYRVQGYSKRTGSLIGEECEFKTEEELDEKLWSYMKDYISYPGVYGIMLGDEPFYTHVTAYAQTYKSLCRLNEKYNLNFYIQYNLNPTTLANDAIGKYYPPLTEQETAMLAGKSQGEKNYYAYKNYIRMFVDAMGVDYIQYDDYPLMVSESLPVKQTFIPTLQAVAEIAEEKGLAFHIVNQTFQMLGGTGHTMQQRYLNTAAAQWINNLTLGHGISQISYFTYVTKADNSTTGEEFVDGSSFINRNGEKTDVYYTMQEIMAQDQKFAPTILQFDYQSSRTIYADTPATYSAYHMQYVVDGPDFVKLKSASVNREFAYITELYDDENDNFMYMAMNVIDPGIEGALAYETITLQFSDEYNYAQVWKNGEVEYYKLDENHSLSVKEAPGEASFIIPFNSTVSKEVPQQTEPNDNSYKLEKGPNEGYTITFKSEDGEVVGERIVRPGVVPFLTAPTKADEGEYEYVFTGWSPSPVQANADATYTATYSKQLKKYQIDFYENGKLVDSQMVESGSLPAEPKKASTVQYDFKFASYETTPVAAYENASYNCTFDSFTRKYDVKYVKVDGTEIVTSQVEYGSVIDYATVKDHVTLPTGHAINYYMLNDSIIDETIYRCTGDVTITVVIGKRQFHIFFKLAADQNPYEVRFFTKLSDTIENPEVPEKEGYDGVWEAYQIKTLQHKVVLAQYTPKQYTITLDAPGETCDKQVINVTYDDTYSLPLITNAEYTGPYYTTIWTVDGVKVANTGVWKRTESITVSPQIDCVYSFENDVVNNCYNNTWSSNTSNRYIGTKNGTAIMHIYNGARGMFEINTNPAYVSDGAQSLRLYKIDNWFGFRFGKHTDTGNTQTFFDYLDAAFALEGVTGVAMDVYSLHMGGKWFLCRSTDISSWDEMKNNQIRTFTAAKNDWTTIVIDKAFYESAKKTLATEKNALNYGIYYDLSNGPIYDTGYSYGMYNGTTETRTLEAYLDNFRVVRGN